MKTLLLLVTLVSGISASLAADLTASFDELYEKKAVLSETEKAALADVDFYLIPGILAESFRWDDRRSYVELSAITRSYFSAQKKLLKKNGFNVKIIKSSSYSVTETQKEIAAAIAASTATNRKALFLTHSLGGLALLEELVQNEKLQAGVRGVIFLQSPFQGSPVADLYLQHPYYSDVWLKPLLPFLNTRDETVAYLTTAARTAFMRANQAGIKRLINKLPVITVGGVVDNARSVFEPSVDVLAYGCVKALGRCTTRKLYAGPYDSSDGLVPFESSRLLSADYVKLPRADHGELVVNIPFVSYKKGRLTVALLKLLLGKTTR